MIKYGTSIRNNTIWLFPFTDPVGLEPTTFRLTAGCSTIELQVNKEVAVWATTNASRFYFYEKVTAIIRIGFGHRFK